MYYVIYQTKGTRSNPLGNEKVEMFSTKEEAVSYYLANRNKMAYGGVSDDEALDLLTFTKSTVDREQKEKLEQAKRGLPLDYLIALAMEDMEP